MPSCTYISLRSARFFIVTRVTRDPICTLPTEQVSSPQVSKVRTVFDASDFKSPTFSSDPVRAEQVGLVFRLSHLLHCHQVNMIISCCLVRFLRSLFAFSGRLMFKSAFECEKS